MYKTTHFRSCKTAHFVQYQSSFFHVSIGKFYTWLNIFTQPAVVMVVTNMKYAPEHRTRMIMTPHSNFIHISRVIVASFLWTFSLLSGISHVASAGSRNLSHLGWSRDDSYTLRKCVFIRWVKWNFVQIYPHRHISQRQPLILVTDCSEKPQRVVWLVRKPHIEDQQKNLMKSHFQPNEVFSLILSKKILNYFHRR